MPKFKKLKIRNRPSISTASLPDIIFILLFFFMVVTVMRNQNLLVNVRVPSATQLQKLEHHSLINYIYIGKPIQTDLYGNAPRVQMNDAFVPIEKLQTAIQTLNRHSYKSTTSLKVDGKITMGIVTDVKTALRKSEQLKVNYAALRKDEN